MWFSVNIPWSPQGTVIRLSMKGKTNPSIMERQCTAGIHSGMAFLQPEGWAGTWMISGRVIGNLCVRSVLRILQPLFTAAGDLCFWEQTEVRHWNMKGQKKGKSTEGGTDSFFKPLPAPGKEHIYPSFLLAHTHGAAAQAASLNSRGCRVIRICATSGWEMAQCCFIN